MVYASTPPRASASRAPWTDPLLGTATTDSHGRWSFTVAAYAHLPRAAQQAAQADHGYLAVRAQTYGVARYLGRTYPVSASGTESAWVGTPRASQPPAGAVAARPVTMTVEPQGRAASSPAVAAAETGDYAAVHAPRLNAAGVLVGDARYVAAGVPTNRFGYEITNGSSYDPNVTSSGVDIADARYAAITPDDGVNPCTYVSSTVVNRAWAYTVLGEHHAGTDSSGSFTYTDGASSQVGTYYSVNGTDFAFNGYVNFSSGGSTANIIEPPGRDGHQTVESLQYIKLRDTYHCLRTGDYYRYRIQENGVYNPGNNWVVFRDGIDVSSWDSQAQYRTYLAHHRTYVNQIRPNVGFVITRNQSITYGAAASALGIGIRAESTHSTAVAQGYRAGRTAIVHHVWGSNGSYLAAPEVVYAYSGS